MPLSRYIGRRALMTFHCVCGTSALRASVRALLVPACATLLLAACSRPEPPDKERPPEPQATTPARHTGLRDAIQAPQDKARAVEGAVDDAAKAQRAAIEAAGG